MATISLSDLLQEVGISEQQLNAEVSDEHLNQTSLFLTSWTTLAPFLGLNEADAAAIEAEGRGEEDKRLKMLQRWKTEKAFTATYQKLIDALLSLKMASHAEKVCRLLQPEAASSGHICENEALCSKVEELQTELFAKTQENEVLRRDSDTLRREIEALQREKQREDSVSSSVSSMKAEIERIEDRFRTETESLRAEVQRLSVHHDQGAASSESPIGLSPSTWLHWRRGADAPKEISGQHAVVIEERVYVDDGYEYVFQYDWRRDTWSTLPACPVEWFGMAQFLGKLITVGGRDRQFSVTGKVYMFNGQQWEEFLQPMPTARHDLTVATRTSSSPKPQVIVACGGREAHGRTVNTVEVYSHASSQWHTAKPLPTPCWSMTSVTIDDTCYLLGGNSMYSYCFSLSLNSLIDNATLPHSQLNGPIWMSVSDTPLILSTAASLRGSLLAIGGWDASTYETSSAIHNLTSDRSWEEVTGVKLPEPRRVSAAVCLPSGELLVIGGSAATDDMFNKRRTVFIASIVD